MAKLDPIHEGVVLACVKHNVDVKHVPTIKQLVFSQNPNLKKADEMIREGKLKV